MPPLPTYSPQPLDEGLRAFLRRDKRPDKRDFINRILGQPVRRLPLWESTVDPQPLATILEKPMAANSFVAEPDDMVELCRRTGLSGTGFGIAHVQGRHDHALQTREGFERIRRRGPRDFSEDFARLARLKQAARGTSIGIWVYTHGPLDSIYLGMELQEFWLLIKDDPGFLYEIGDYLLECNRRLVERIVEAGIDWLHIGDDVAFRSGLMAPPDFFFDFYPSRLKHLIEPAKKAGIPVTFHSDGKVDGIVEMLIACGVDAMHPLEPYSNDPLEIARIAGGRIGLIGNVELAQSTPAQAESRVRELISGMGNRYVPASSHSITNDVAPETYLAFLRAVHGATHTVPDSPPQ